MAAPDRVSCTARGDAAIPAGGVWDHYEPLGVLSAGSFGIVSKVKRKHDGRVLVWKELNFGVMREKEKQLVVSEVRALRSTAPSEWLWSCEHKEHCDHLVQRRR